MSEEIKQLQDQIFELHTKLCGYIDWKDGLEEALKECRAEKKEMKEKLKESRAQKKELRKRNEVLENKIKEVQSLLKTVVGEEDASPPKKRKTTSSVGKQW